MYKDPIEGNAIADLEKANLSVKASVAQLQVMVIFQFIKKIIVSIKVVQCVCDFAIGRILLQTYKSIASYFSQLVK